MQCLRGMCVRTQEGLGLLSREGLSCNDELWILRGSAYVWIVRPVALCYCTVSFAVFLPTRGIDAIGSEDWNHSNVSPSSRVSATIQVTNSTKRMTKFKEPE